jgi:TolB-like protein/DNA-binding SARP family transcriptional activator
MLSLTTLGAVRLDDTAGLALPHPILAQPKRLALLAYLVVGRPGALVFRDALLALLWPDHDATRARRSLRQTLYHLRKELGDDVVVGGGQAGVGVDASRLWCDAVAFERAVVEDRLEAAVELYRGEFMPGFHAGGGVDCERWLDETRDRLRRKAVAAASALAQRAEASGEHERAIAYARWMADVVPYDERVGRTLIRLLAGSGDRAGAVTAYRELASRLDRELDLEPDADTTALLAAVRTGVDPEAGAKPDRDAASAGAASAGAAFAGHAAGGVPVDGAGGRKADREHALAVLPFASLSGTASEVRFADGLTEMLITELARTTSLGIVSRTSILQYRRGEHSLAAVAGELGVDRVVEGTVLEHGDRIRATAQLLTTPPERHIWADIFERVVEDPLTDQARMAGDIARAVEAALARAAASRMESANSAARDAYFRGRCQFVRLTPASVMEAIRQYQEAIRLDPDFAPAHASLAYAYGALARTGRIAPAEAYAQARRRAERALALDPQNVEAHIALGVCATVLDRDWELAERHLQRGIQRGPALAESFWVYSYFLCVTGRHDDACRAARRARELDPMAPSIWLNEVLTLAATGQAEAALASATDFAAFHRDSSASAFGFGVACEVSGNHAEAARSFARAVELGGGPHSTAAQAHNLACDGRPDEARRLLDQLLAIDDAYVPPTSLARIHAALGEADEAFLCLHRAVAVRDDWLLLMDGWPRYDRIRDDPRFAELRRSLGLPGVPAVPGVSGIPGVPGLPGVVV